MSFALAPAQLRVGEPPLAGSSPWTTVTQGYPPYPGQKQLGPQSYPTTFPVVGEARSGDDMNLLSMSRTPLVVAIRMNAVARTLCDGSHIPRGKLVIVAQRKNAKKEVQYTLYDPTNTAALANDNDDNKMYFGYYGIVASDVMMHQPTDDTSNTHLTLSNTVVSIAVANVDMMLVDDSQDLGIGRVYAVESALVSPPFSASILTHPIGAAKKKSAQVYFSFQPCRIGDVPDDLAQPDLPPIASAMVDVAPGKVDAGYVDVASSCAKLGAAAATMINGEATPLGPHSSMDDNLFHGFTRVTDESIEAAPNSVAAALLYSHGNATERDAEHLSQRHELVINRRIPEAVAGNVNKHTGKPLKKYLAHPGIFDCEGAYGQNPCVWKDPAHGAVFAEKYSQVVRHAFATRKALDVDQCHDLIAHLATPAE